MSFWWKKVLSQGSPEMFSIRETQLDLDAFGSQIQGTTLHIQKSPFPLMLVKPPNTSQWKNVFHIKSLELYHILKRPDPMYRSVMFVKSSATCNPAADSFHFAWNVERKFLGRIHQACQRTCFLCKFWEIPYGE